MEHNKRRINAMLLALCMVFTAFVAVVSLPVGAHKMSNGADFEIYWQDAWMEDDPDLVASDEPIIFNYDNNAGRAIFLGDQGVDIVLEVYNRNGAAADATDDVYLTLAVGPGGSSIIDNIPTSRWPLSGDYDDFDDDERIDDNPGGGGGNLPRFEIDIATSGAVNSVYTNALRLTINYNDGSAKTDTFDFSIYVSSVFDPAPVDDHEDLPGIDETDSDPEFEAGVLMQEGRINLQEYAPFSISDVEGTLSSMPTGITLSGGYTMASNPSPGNPFNLFWRFDVASNVLPGIKSANLAIEYVRSDTGDTINEGARPTEIVVDFTSRLTASLQNSVTITQNTLQATLSVIFTNSGNVQLNDVVIRPDPDGDWLDVKFHHYENDDDVYETEVALGTLAVGAPSTAQTVVVATNMMLPNGTHRAPFAWSAWVYEDGSTGDASRWVMVGGYMYSNDPSSATPEVERLYEDNNENRRWDLGTDTQVEPVWDGAFVDFMVNDNNGLTWEAYMIGEVEAGRDDAMTNADVTYTTIWIRIVNMELVDYKDLVVELATGPDSPFFDPADHDATSLMMNPTSDTEIDADDYADVYFTVDVNAGWWQEASNSADYIKPETYMVDLTIDATNDHSEERVSNVVVPASVNINGFGPELFANIVTVGKFSPGGSFDLTVTIRNYGDDIAREVDAYLRADFVAGWTIVDQFVTSIGGYGGEGNAPVGDASWGWSTNWMGYDSFNKTHNVRPAELGVDSVPQVVELYDWIKRRETPPQGKILWIHLDRLEPGTEHSFTFEMISDVNMVEGMVYYETLELEFVDSNGETYGPDPFEIQYDHYAPPQEVLIRAGKGEAYNTDEFDFSVLLYFIILLVIVFIVFLIGYALGGRGGKGRAEEAGFDDYEPEYGAPPEPEEDMGAPNLDSDLGPPMPQDKPPE